MKVNELWDKFWRFTDEGKYDKMVSWINGLLKKDVDNIDFRHIYLQAILWKGKDTELEQIEPIFANFCTSFIREKEKCKKITVAKAYSYRGEIKHYALDRRKDFDKALVILKTLKQSDAEVKYLKQYIKLAYPLHVRQYLFIDRNYINMFKF
jgi:hypothetical protein